MSTKAAEIVDTEMWFEVEYGYRGADDWFTYADKYDTMQAARTEMDRLKSSRAIHSLEFRLVRKVITTEVVQDAE